MGAGQMTDESYQEHVASIEATLSDPAFKSARVTAFTDSTDAMRAFEIEWRTEEGRARLTGRTPLMLERDRILYSEDLRAQSDRHHILFFKDARVTRDYAAHILRMSQVSRAICGRLGLNSDLAEAIALGAKVGGVPFIHVGKSAVDKWVRAHVKELDSASSHPVGSQANRVGQQLALLDEQGNELPLPSWVDELEDPALRVQVQDYLPWAAGATNGTAYSSGQQSYWALSLRPFQLSAKRPYVPQTMYGVWNHSLSATRDTAKFSHSVTLAGSNTTLRLNDGHLTHEAVVVRYADDISWVIENLNEASKSATLAGARDDIFTNLARELQSSDMPGPLHLAITPTPDIGRMYTYFINDLVDTSGKTLREYGVQRPTETHPAISLSETAARMLRLMKQFLESSVYSDDRLRYRNRTLESITETVLDVFWESRGQALTDFVQGRARLEGWSAEDKATGLELLNTPVHRVQACVDALSIMSDREVYRLLGLEAL
jgi:dGTP triphosphohydrolase